MNVTKIENATPHAINLIYDGEVYFTIEPSMDPIRLNDEWSPIGTFNVGGITIPFEFPEYSSVDNDGEQIELPEKADGVYYIVSKFIAEAFPERSDFLMVGKLVRGEKGVIIGAECLSHIRGKAFLDPM